MDRNNGNQPPTFEDVEFDDRPAKVYPTIEGGTYNAVLVGFETVDKPDWKIESEAAKLRAKGSSEPLDKKQWRWTFRITDTVELHDTAEDGQEVTRLVTNYDISDFCNRNWHERSTAGKWAAGIAGLSKYSAQGMKDAGITSSKSMFNRPCRITVSEVKSERTKGWSNYIKGVESPNAGRGRGAAVAGQPVKDLDFDEEEAYVDTVPDFNAPEPVAARRGK